MRKINLTDKVYLKKCENYEQDRINTVISDLLDSICADNGFSGDFEGKKVAIKPNLLAKRKPEDNVTSRPEIVIAAAKYFVDKKAEVVICDSPGGAYTIALLTGIYKASGMDVAAKESGAKLNEDLSYREMTIPEGKTVKTFNIITPLAECDLIVNLAKLKTHALCEMTAAVKNLFGSVPGLQKAEMHARLPKREDFASQIVDLCLLNSPQINIVDAVIAMEGNGPASGVKKKVGAIAGSANPFALDLFCSSLMCYKPKEVGTVAESIKRGLCPKNAAALAVIGEKPSDYTSYFVRPDGNAGGFLKKLPNMLGGKIQKILEPKPTVVKSKCVGCGECVSACPQKTMTIIDRKVSINYDKCIKCYCCQELCPKKAIKVKRNILFVIPDIFSKKK